MKSPKSPFLKIMALFLATLMILGTVPNSVFAAEKADSTAIVAETSEATEITVSSEAESTTAPIESENSSENSTESAKVTEASSEPTEAAEATEVPTETGDQNSPVPLKTDVSYYEDYFAVLKARQEGLSYRIVTANAVFANPQICAYPFDVDPDISSIGFEIQLNGVTYTDDPVVNPGGDLTVTVADIFDHADPDSIQVFDISGDHWILLPHDRFEVKESSAEISFYTPKLNSRFAIIEGFSEAAVYDVNYSTEIGSYVNMGVNNKTAWCVEGQNPYGFGNSQTGTFAIHLVHRPSTDSKGKTVGYEDYVAAGCLEYWKPAPVISKGQIVTVRLPGSIGGWSKLSEAQRRQIVGYMLYGVRYISDHSFNNNLGSPTIGSTNPLVNMAYAQQVIIWAAVKGVDPLTAASYYKNDVLHYAKIIVDYAKRNPEKYDYDKTVLLVGEGNSQQDMVVVVKPEKETPPKGNIIVDKTVTGSNALAGWVMELYDSYYNAKHGIDPIESVRTDSQGRAQFREVLNGTYYVREAPESRQSGDLRFWTLSDKILTAEVLSNTVNAGTIQNSYEQKYEYGLRKTSLCSEAVRQQLEGNPMYSLSGAKYKVSLNGKQQEILKTDDQGIAIGKKLYPAGTKLTIQEIEAPAGYKLDPTEYTLLITTGDNVLAVEDEPVFDPPFGITKVDKSTSTPQGDSSFSGAIFKWEYFSNMNWEGKPTRTWYFQTDKNGVADFMEKNLAPGYTSDPLYIDNGGNPDMPIGTITITEIKNSLGYIVLPEPLNCSILADPGSVSGAKHEFSPDSLKYIKDMGMGNFDVYEPADHTLYGSISLDKADSVTGSVPQGNADLSAKFQIINKSSHSVQIEGFSLAHPGEVCCEFTTDAEGHCSSGKIFPLGSYEITESKAPAGYKLNSSWKQTFSVTEKAQHFDFTLSSGNACQNELDLMGSFSMNKLDMDTGHTPQGDGTLGGAVFELINNSKNAIFWNEKSILPGEVLMTFSTDENGHYEYAGLPMGSYYIQELTPPDGYLWDSLWQYDFDITPEKKDITIQDESSCQNYILKGSLKIIKQDALLEDASHKNLPLDGITFTITNESKNPVLIDGTMYQPGSVIMALPIAWDGSCWSAATEQILPYGTYGIQENEMTPGMANDHYLVDPEKKLVEVHGDEAPAEITYLDQMADGKIIIHKVDPMGQPLAGAKFLLQYSLDNGATWESVFYSETISKGGCSTPELQDSTLTTGEDGVIAFAGLHPLVLYRVTEVEAPEGYVLLSSAAFEGRLPQGEFVYTMTVHNSPGFTFPTTGTNSLHLCLLTGFALSSLALIACIYVVAAKKRKASHI